MRLSQLGSWILPSFSLGVVVPRGHPGMLLSAGRVKQPGTRELTDEGRAEAIVGQDLTSGMGPWCFAACCNELGRH